MPSSTGGGFVALAQVLECDLGSEGAHAHGPSRTAQVQQALGPHVVRVLPGADDSTLLVVFAAERHAVQALEDNRSGFRLRSMQQASHAARQIAATIRQSQHAQPSEELCDGMQEASVSAAYHVPSFSCLIVLLQPHLRQPDPRPTAAPPRACSPVLSVCACRA